MKKSFQHITKYWNIIVIGDEFAVNYGKIGTIGKVQVKSFESDSECMKEAEKLIRQKLRKGYVECPFDWDNHMYVDDPEVGPSFLTSHPKYQECFNDDSLWIVRKNMLRSGMMLAPMHWLCTKKCSERIESFVIFHTLTP
nr:WGR domain-containing protein [Exiguobacterium sp. s129]